MLRAFLKGTEVKTKDKQIFCYVKELVLIFKYTPSITFWSLSLYFVNVYWNSIFGAFSWSFKSATHWTCMTHLHHQFQSNITSFCRYIFPKFDICWTDFLQMKIRIPCQTETYLVANYGPNWFEPVTKWDWKKSPSNVFDNGMWPKEEWKNVIQVFK